MTDTPAWAAAVAAIGQDSFGDRLLAVLRAIASADLCSAFRIGPQGGLTCLLAAGRHPDIPDFAETASLAYAREFWRSDRISQQVLTQGRDTVRLVRQGWSAIADPDYRRTCYERGGIVERLTLYSAGYMVSAYRGRESGHSTPAQVEALTAAADMVVALVIKHAEFSARTAIPVTATEAARQFMDCGRALSEREAVVAAGLMLGRSQKEISQATGLAVSSIVTYRRRAYRKLGVSDRHGLPQVLAPDGSGCRPD